MHRVMVVDGSEERIASRSSAGARARIEAVAVAAVPPLLFAALSTAGSPLPVAVAVALGTSLAGAVLRLVRRDGLRAAGLGLAITAACAVVATVTGEARAFFLLPALVPFAVVAVCLTTMSVRRPLTGLLLNRISGGPGDWYRRPRILRVHQVGTLCAVLINVVNAVVQVVFYAAGDTVVLAVAHVATGPVFAALASAVLVAARRAVVSSR